jgi:DNA-binding NarL/FixJ family response regulator
LADVLKGKSAELLAAIIRKVHAGEVFIQPEIASRALRASMHGGGGMVESLSDREKEVLGMLGIPNEEIAYKLHIAEGAVKNHVSNILGKLQAQNRTEAADIARRRGLI